MKDIFESPAVQVQKQNFRLQYTVNSLFDYKKANDWIDQAKHKPIPKQLFSEFWHEGEFCILFADTNTGKSILAVQIADSISKGKAIAGFNLEAERQKVLYFDFELSDKQFEGRYSEEYQYHYQFSDNFYRVELNKDSNVTPENFQDKLQKSLEQTILQTGAKILIIDNITFLRYETTRANDALSLMKYLKQLKNKYNLSVLTLAHTPKRAQARPLQRNDLQGSKMLINFCDSAFAIGESTQDTSLKYIKQIKARQTEIVYDTDNVCLCRIDKQDSFLQFCFVEYAEESEHLKKLTEEDKENMKQNIISLSKKGKSLREIAKDIGVSHMKVKRVLEKL